MIELLREKRQFFVTLLLWWLVAQYVGETAAYLFIPFTILNFWKKEMYEELFVGFFFMLLMSSKVEFARNFKDIYVLILFAVVAFSKEMRFNTRMLMFFTPFFFVAFICLFFSDILFQSFQKTLSYLLMLLIIPTYIDHIYTEKGPSFFKTITILVILFLLLGLVMRYISPEEVYLIGRYRGVFLFNPNGLGLFLMLFFLYYSIITDIYPDLFEFKEELFIYGLSILILYMCESRSSIIASLIFLFFKSFYKISPAIGFIIFVVVAALYQVIEENTQPLIIALGLGDYFRIETIDTGSGRYVAWEFAWTNIQENFYIGKGIGYTDFLFHKYFNELAVLGHVGNAHNSYLTIWLDTGLIGLLCYMFALVFNFIKSTKISHLAIPVMYAVLFSVYYESWLSASLNPYTIQVFSILAILTSDVIRQKKEEGIISVQ